MDVRRNMVIGARKRFDYFGNRVKKGAKFDTLGKNRFELHRPRMEREKGYC